MESVFKKIIILCLIILGTTLPVTIPLTEADYYITSNDFKKIENKHLTFQITIVNEGEKTFALSANKYYTYIYKNNTMGGINGLEYSDDEITNTTYNTFNFTIEKIVVNNQSCLIADPQKHLSDIVGKMGLGFFKDKDENAVKDQSLFHRILMAQSEHCFYFDFSNSTSNLVIGDCPKEGNHTPNIENYTRTENLYTNENGELSWSLALNKIFYDNKELEKEKSNYVKNAYISVEDGMIEAPRNFYDLIQKEYFSKFNCTLTPGDLIYIQCDNNAISDFKNITFENVLSGAIFKFTKDDLFDSEGQFKIRFRNQSDDFEDKWIFGLPFLKKYKLVFEKFNDTRGGQIWVEKTEDQLPNPDDHKELKVWDYVLYVVILIIMVGFLGFGYYMTCGHKDDDEEDNDDEKPEDDQPKQPILIDEGPTLS